MPQTHDFGRLFVHGYRHPMDDVRRFTRTETVEVEAPYRLGKGLCVRIHGRRGFVVGLWDSCSMVSYPSWYPVRAEWRDEVRTEAMALYEALKARDMTLAGELGPSDEIVGWQAPMWDDDDAW